MNLEVITERSASGDDAPPLLFVHGAWHAGWCWQDFLRFFAEHGYTSHALSLRGHGASAAPRSLRTTSIRDYVEDLSAVVRRLTSPPVLVAHSMGGFIVHHYLRLRSRVQEPRGLVFLASVPPRGAWRATWHAMRRHPLAFARANLRLSLYPMISSVERASDLLFSHRLPPPQVAQHQALLQEESYRAYLDMLLRPIRGKAETSVPVLVLHASDDALIDAADMRALASFYDAEVDVMEDTAHDMMLGPGWEAVAHRTLRWLRENGLGASPRS